MKMLSRILFIRPYGTFHEIDLHFPTTELVGYYQASLRDSFLPVL